MKVGILTGGGDCPGLNPAIRGVVYRGLGLRLWSSSGFMEGWRGLVKGILRAARHSRIGRRDPLSGRDDSGIVADQPLQEARKTSNAVLANIKSGGLRCHRRLWRRRHARRCRPKLYSEHGVATVGVPKTMDNDLNQTRTSHSALIRRRAVGMEALDRLRDTARSHRRVMVLEVMGRHAGWVAALRRPRRRRGFRDHAAGTDRWTSMR